MTRRISRFIKRAVMKECEPDAVEAIAARKRVCNTVAVEVAAEACRLLCPFYKYPVYDMRPYGAAGQAVPFVHDVDGEPKPCFVGKLKAAVGNPKVWALTST